MFDSLVIGVALILRRNASFQVRMCVFVRICENRGFDVFVYP